MDKIQIDAFWSKVEITDNVKDCWNWTGAKKPTGYGNVRIDKVYKLAHRVAFELAHEEIPSGFIVCHICDNPSCCNPSHLMLGTVKSNAADMLIKNRQKKTDPLNRGERNINSKLTDDMVREIKVLLSNGESQYEIAKKYGVSQPAIGSIKLGKTWRHIK